MGHHQQCGTSKQSLSVTQRRIRRRRETDCMLQTARTADESPLKMEQLAVAMAHHLIMHVINRRRSNKNQRALVELHGQSCQHQRLGRTAGYDINQTENVALLHKMISTYYTFSRHRYQQATVCHLPHLYMSLYNTYSQH